MDELKPCPFCGQQPLRKEVTFWTGMRSDVIRVEFQHHCEMQSPRTRIYINASGVTDAEARGAWNTRVPATAQGRGSGK